MIGRNRSSAVTSPAPSSTSGDSKADGKHEAGANRLGVKSQLPASAARTSSASTPRGSILDKALRAVGLAPQQPTPRMVKEMFMLKASNFERANKIKLPDTPEVLAKEFAETQPAGDANQVARQMDAFIAALVPNVTFSGRKQDDKAAIGDESTRHQLQTEHQRGRDVQGLAGKLAARADSPAPSGSAEGVKPSEGAARHMQVKNIITNVLENFEYPADAYDTHKLAAMFLKDHCVPRELVAPEHIRTEFERLYANHPQNLSDFRRSSPPPLDMLD